MRIVMNRYGISKSGRLLAKELGIKMLSLTGSRFRGKYADVVINWGNGKGNVGSAKQINKIKNVQIASNKLHTLQALEALGVPTPTWSTSLDDFSPSQLLYGRSDLYGHSGKGILVGTAEELPYCPLYVQAIDKVAEYRAIVIGDKVVDFKKKKRRRTPEGEEQIVHDEHIWSHSGGYIFARNDFIVPPSAGSLAIDACSAIGLDFGAVDILEDIEGKLYVLEINTAFGIEGTTLDLVVCAFKELIDGDE